jgi:predicted DNA-binding transcriptional regulator YafY
MESLEPKKLAILHILEILKRHTDANHSITHKEILSLLENEYGLSIERKAVGRNISLLIEAGYDIETGPRGSRLISREFEDSELRLLIDGVLSSKHVNPHHSRDLISKLSSLSSKYFGRHVKNIYSVSDFHKTDNSGLFYTIDVIDEAIMLSKVVEYDYNKYGADKKLHKSSFQRVSPFQLILHNQRYYLMGYSSYWKQMVYHRLDHITNIRISERAAVKITDIEGYEGGINYQNITTSMPYMFSDVPQRVTFLVKSQAIDHVIDWFGRDVKIEETAHGDLYRVSLFVSTAAMHYWALQFSESVEIISPTSLRERVRDTLKASLEKYQK